MNGLMRLALNGECVDSAEAASGGISVSGLAASQEGQSRVYTWKMKGDLFCTCKGPSHPQLSDTYCLPWRLSSGCPSHWMSPFDPLSTLCSTDKTNLCPHPPHPLANFHFNTMGCK